MDERARAAGLDSLVRNLSQLLQAIEGCVGLHLVLPSLMLIYGGIDVLGSLERRSDEGTRASFMRWVEAYLLPAKSLGCSAVDLYAARCGVLHSFSAESDLYREGKARRLIYAWGTAPAAKLERTADLLGYADLTVHLNDLAMVFAEALDRYLSEIWSDSERRETILAAAAGAWLSHMPTSVLDAFLERKDADS
jgi:hypothetical protein